MIAINDNTYLHFSFLKNSNENEWAERRKFNKN
jgi:hypothetical protein